MWLLQFHFLKVSIVSAIGKQLKSVNLKGVKRITVQFDPFAENVKSTR